MSTIKNLLTFGAYGRIEKAMKKYNKVKKRYNSRLYKMKSKSREVDALLETVVQVKIEAIKDLSTFKEFSVDNIENPLFNSNKFKSANFKHIKQTLEKGQLALTAATGITVGATAGVGTALATWGLASTFGAASTGTAISTLSGAAATKATLALLGGGAVAAGGGGIMAGATVLGGIVAIPALVALGVFSHFSAKKKIAEIESAMYKMQNYMCYMETNMIRLKEIQRRSNKLIRLMKKKSKKLKYELNIANRIVNGEMNKITSFYHQIRTIIFNRSVAKLANGISILIDTPIFNEDTEKAILNKMSNKKNGTAYKMLAILLLAAVLYIFAVPLYKDITPFKTLSKKISGLYEDKLEVETAYEEPSATQEVSTDTSGVDGTILETEEVDSNSSEDDSKTVLENAEKPTEAKIEVDPNDDFRFNAAIDAIRQGDMVSLKSLLGKGLDPRGNSESRDDLIFYSVIESNLEAVHLLLNAGSEINVMGRYTAITPLMIVAEKGNIEILRALMGAGADVNTIAGDRTALTVAVDFGKLEIVKELISYGADVNPQIEGDSPLTNANRFSHYEIKEILEQAGAEYY